MSLRRFIARLHRWIGLLLVVVLGIVGLSGSLLVWEQELDGLMNPALLRPPVSNTACLTPLVLRQQVQAHYPDTHVNQLDLACQPGQAVRFWLKPANGQTLSNDQVFLNPHTGKITGERRWGDISQGFSLNLIPFIYRLHSELLLGDTGKTVLGITALLWLLMSISGVFLSVPRRGARWLQRWYQAWRLPLRFKGGMFLWHRAAGLWFVPLFLVFAWSGVSFTLKESVYRPVMSNLFTLQIGNRALPTLPTPQTQPALTWEEALRLSRLYMNQAMAAASGFNVHAEFRLAYLPKQAVFHYRVTSSLDARRRGETSLWIDANTGAPVAWFLPTGKANGDSIGAWLKALHMAETGGIGYRILASLTGLALFGLCLTGVWQWSAKQKNLRKRTA